jgi:hypothetical protein
MAQPKVIFGVPAGEGKQYGAPRDAMPQIAV